MLFFPFRRLTPGKANIQRKPKNETFERVIELYNKDFQDAKKIEADNEKLIKINGDNAIDKQIEQYENLKPLNLSVIQKTLIDEIKIIYNEKFGEDISIPEFEVVQWIESGLKLHNEEDNCKFCQGKLDLSGVKSKIAQYKENKRHKATKKLNQLREQLDSILESIRIIEIESKSYITNLGIEIGKYFSEILKKKEIVETFVISCQSKIDNIEIKQNFDFELLAETLKELECTIKIISDIKNEQLLELRKRQINLTSLVKGAVGLEIIQSKTIEDKQKV